MKRYVVIYFSNCNQLLSYNKILQITQFSNQIKTDANFEVKEILSDIWVTIFCTFSRTLIRYLNVMRIYPLSNYFQKIFRNRWMTNNMFFVRLHVSLGVVCIWKCFWCRHSAKSTTRHYTLPQVGHKNPVILTSQSISCWIRRIVNSNTYQKKAINV